MTKEERELVIIDISARFPYGVKVQINSDIKKVVGVKNGCVVTKERGLFSSTIEYITRIECCKPYLRSMSSMTEEESIELRTIINDWWNKEFFTLIDEPMIEYALSFINYTLNPTLFDWLNKKHFDYRGFIKKGLALEAPEGMYN